MAEYLKIGMQHEDDGNYEEAVKCYEEAIKENNHFAYFFLALMYRDGRGVEQDDCKYFEYLSLAIENGNKNGFGHLAKCYELGIGCEVDYKKALIWYEKDAENGDYISAVRVASWYAEEENKVKTDYNKAIEYYEMALENAGEDDNLSIAYNGQGIAYAGLYDETEDQKHFEKAINCFEASVNLGDKKAEKLLEFLYEQNKNYASDDKKPSQNYNCEKSELSYDQIQQKNNLQVELTRGLFLLVARAALYIVGILLLYNCYINQGNSDDVGLYLVKLIFGAVLCSVFEIVPSLKSSLNYEDKVNKILHQEYKVTITEERIRVGKNRSFVMILFGIVSGIFTGIIVTPFKVIGGIFKIISLKKKISEINCSVIRKPNAKKEHKKVIEEEKADNKGTYSFFKKTRNNLKVMLALSIFLLLISVYAMAAGFYIDYDINLFDFSNEESFKNISLLFLNHYNFPLIANCFFHIILISLCINGKVKLSTIIILLLLASILKNYFDLFYYEYYHDYLDLIEMLDLVSGEYSVRIFSIDVSTYKYILLLNDYGTILFDVYIIIGYVAQTKHNRLIESDESYKKYVEYVNSKKQR